MKVLPPLTNEDQMLAGLSYPLWPIAPVFVLKSKKREDPFLVYHAYHGLAWGGASTASLLSVFLFLMLFFRIMPGGSTFLPGFVGVTIFFAGWIALFLVMLYSLFLGWRASAGELIKLPYIGDWAEERMIAESGMSHSQFISSLHVEGLDEALQAQNARPEASHVPPPSAPGHYSGGAGEPAGPSHQVAHDLRPQAQAAAGKPTPGPLDRVPTSNRTAQPRAIQPDSSEARMMDQMRAKRPAQGGPLGKKDTNVLRQWLSEDD